MIPPLVSFVTWNRMGLSIKSLTALLNTVDDFELHITDNGSQDDTWNFISDVKDPRIRCRTRFDANRGQVYAVNHNLAKRKENQYFITVDSDVCIHTPDWITQFLRAFELFPEAALLGAVTREYYGRYKHPAIKRESGETFYIQSCKGFVEGCCQCLRPEILNSLGYWSEENYMGDVEMCHRICTCTPYKVGFLPSVEIDQPQWIYCEDCGVRAGCHLYNTGKTCFSIWKDGYRNPKFKALFNWKYDQYIKELERGTRTPYCASIHDARSIQEHAYNRKWAEENFNFYITRR